MPSKSRDLGNQLERCLDSSIWSESGLETKVKEGFASSTIDGMVFIACVCAP